MEAKLTHLLQTVSSHEHQGCFDLTDRGLLLADGVFDTSRVVAGRVILKSEHLERLVRDAAALGIEVPIREVEDLAGRALEQADEGALRLTVTRGTGGRGLAGDIAGAPTMLARFTPMDLPFPAPAVRLGTSDIRRNPTSPTTRHKTLSYTDNVLALRQAHVQGFDEALFLSIEGAVACASVANVFALSGRRLLTPPQLDGAMPGIVRNWLIEAAGKAGYEVAEERILPEQLLRADHVFLTNSLRVLQPVTSLGNHPLDPVLPDDLLALGRSLIEEGGT